MANNVFGYEEFMGNNSSSQTLGHTFFSHIQPKLSGIYSMVRGGDDEKEGKDGYKVVELYILWTSVALYNIYLPILRLNLGGKESSEKRCRRLSP